MIFRSGKFIFFILILLSVKAFSQSVIINYPDSNSVWRFGNVDSVKWTSNYSSGLIKIDFSSDGGTTYLNLADSLTDNGTYVFTNNLPVTQNAKLRITKLDSGLVFYSDIFIVDTVKTISVINPNLTSFWEGNSSQTISWSSTGIINNVNILYYNGLTWENISGEQNITNSGSYVWTVPNQSNPTAMIKIEDASDGTIFGISDTFTVSEERTISITEPVLGEVIDTNSIKNITWNYTGKIDSVVLKIYNGLNWVNLNNGTAVQNTGSYLWNVDNVITDSAKIKIQDAKDSTVQSISSVFRTSDIRTLTVINPDSLSIWDVGTSQQINWNSTGKVENVNILYYNGLTWENISGAQNITNSGSYFWTVPNQSNLTAMIKIEDATDGSIFGISDTFTVSEVRTITITEPVLGEVIDTNSTKNITWNYTGKIDSVILKFYNGLSWVNLNNGIAVQNTGSYSWNVDNVITDSAKIEIQDAKDSTVQSISSVFRTSDIRTISIIQPDSLSSWEGETVHQITWNSSGKIDSVKIEYFDGTVWQLVSGKAYNNGTYNWLVPNTPTIIAKIKISDFKDSTISNISKEFKILEKRTVTISYPTVTDSLYGNLVDTIRWSNTGNIPMVDVFYKNGLSWIQLADSIINTNKFPFTIPDSTFNTMFIVADASNNTIADTSDLIQIFKAEIKITFPNSTSVLASETVDTIKWNTKGKVDTIGISYFDGTSWTNITGANKIFNAGMFVWNKPYINTDSVQIKIVDFYDSTRISLSDKFIVLRGSINITRPTGTESWLKGSKQNIRWAADSLSYVKLEYSYDGISWNLIADSIDVSVKKYLWTLPDTSVTKIKVRLSEPSLQNIFDTTSVSVFSSLFPDTTITILPLGNSITKGVNDPLKTDGTKFGYRFYLWDSLTINDYNVDFIGSESAGYDVFPDYNHGGFGGTNVWQIYSILNTGYNPKNTGTVVTAGPYLNYYPADIILLHIGTNDVELTHMKDIDSILNVAYRTDPNVWVVLAKIVNRKDPSPGFDRNIITTFNDSLELLAERRIDDGDKLILVDMENGANLNYATDFFDDKHPLDLGYHKMMSQWFYALNLLLDPGTKVSPVVNSIPRTAVLKGNTYSYNFSATGIGTPRYFFNDFYTPFDDMTINQYTGKLTWNPVNSGNYNLELKAVNNSGSDYQTFSVNVIDSSQLPSNLLAYWKFDELSGSRSFFDIYNNLEAKTSTTNPPNVQIGKIKKSIYFDGTANLNVESSPQINFAGVNDFAIEMWVKTNNNAVENKYILHRYNGSGKSVLIVGQNPTNNIYLYLRDNSNISFKLTSKQIINDGQWHHVVFTRSSTANNLKLYFDGTLDTSLAATYSSDFSSDSLLNIGHKNELQDYIGYLDELAFYNYDMPLDTVYSHFTKGKYGKEYFENILLAKGKLFLEGAYDSTNARMNNFINSFIPLQSPYADSLTASSVPNNIVDWIELELRDQNDSSVVVSSRSVFLDTTGTLWDAEFTDTNIVFNTKPGNYFLVAKHRNHLGVMTNSSLTLNLVPLFVDFSDTLNVKGGAGAINYIGNGNFGLIGGETNASGIITFADADNISLQLNQFGYLNSDVNLSGIVTFADKDLIKKNLNKFQKY